MVGLVETMQMTAHGLRLTAYGPDEDEIRIVERDRHEGTGDVRGVPTFPIFRIPRTRES
jgi:hypothetical protein